MDDLTTLLRMTSDGAPPNRVDLDGLIAGEQRRRRTRRITACAAAAVVVAAGLSVTLTARDRSPAPSVNRPIATPVTTGPACKHFVSPDVTPPGSEAVVQRLTAALAGLLPDGARPGPRAACAQVEFVYDPNARGYRATARVDAGGDEYMLTVVVSATAPGTVPACPNGDVLDCERTDVPGGAVAMAELGAFSAEQAQRAVRVFRPDATTVEIVALGPRAALPSAQRLTAIGLSPGLTPYP